MARNQHTSSSKMKAIEAFCAKVRQEVTQDEYLRLLQYLHGYDNGPERISSPTCLKDKVADLLKKYPGFFQEFLSLFNVDSNGADDGFNNHNNRMSAFRLFGYTISVSKSPDEPESSQRNSKAILDEIGHRALRFCEKVRKETSSKEYLELLECLHYFGTGKISKKSMKMMVNEKFPKFMDDFLDVVEFYERFYASLTQSSSSSSSSTESDQKTMMRNKGNKLKSTIKHPDDELTPSYKFLPRHVSSADQSRCFEPGDREVLNFCCYSKGSFGSGCRPKDPIQQKLNEDEDALFERDMFVERLRSTINNATKLDEAISAGEIEDPNPEVVKNYLTALNFRFIESLYGKKGLKVVEDLRHSPKAVLPIVLRQLDQTKGKITSKFTCYKF